MRNLSVVNVIELSYSDFIDIFPEFSGVSQNAIERQIRISTGLLNKDALGEFYQDCIGLLSAHYLCLRYNISSEMSKNGINQSMMNSGLINSVSASSGSLSESYSHNSLISGDDPTTADWSRTEYGLQLLSIIGMQIDPCSVVYSGYIGSYHN